VAESELQVEHLTLAGKWAVIKATLCDRQTEIISTCLNAVKRAFFLLCVIICFGLRGFAQENPSEYQLKAAFLFNFAKFVEWPPQAFPETNSPIVIGVLGTNVFGSDLERTIRNKTVNNHPFQFKEFTSATEAIHCHILFVSPSEKDRLRQIVEALHNASVLTVSETDQFLTAGGMINFTIENNKIRFQINDEHAKKAGLKISSKLLSLAARAH
jgi:hypothetical protein